MPDELDCPACEEGEIWNGDAWVTCWVCNGTGRITEKQFDEWDKRETLSEVGGLYARSK